MRRLLHVIKSAVKVILTGDFSPARFWSIRQKIPQSNRFTRRIYSFLYARYLTLHNASVPIESRIASCPSFPHGISGIFISAGAEIGRNCTIFHQVTIGSNTLEGSKNQGAPKIGDNVFIGCGAKIIGGVHVGNNACIGANCVVTHDIPDNCTVVMPAPRIIEHHRSNPPEFIGWADYVSRKGESAS